MTVIEASFVRVAGTLADGTLRLVVDVEPRNAQAAFALFNQPGTAMALAALKPTKLDDELPVPQPVVKESLTPEAPKGGALAKLAGMWCADKTFQSWLGVYDVADGDPEGRAALRLYEVCDIQSRRQLDHDPEAAERFNARIRGPYMKWRASKGLA